MVNLLARSSSAPAQRRWNEAEHVLRYLHYTFDRSLFFLYGVKSKLMTYADTRYLFDAHQARSLSGYVFM